MKRKICVVVTARPSYSRVKNALKAIKNHNDVSSGENITARLSKGFLELEVKEVIEKK